MYVVWKKRRLAAARRGPLCPHAAAHRYALKPLIVRYAPGATQEYEVVARLPALRSCCRRSVEARRRWWAKVDPLLDRIRRRCQLRRQEVDLPTLERSLRRRIPRPAPAAAPPPPPTTGTTPEPPLQTASCWGVIGVCPGSGAKAIKAGLNETLARLRRRGAPLAELREADQAARECLSRLASGAW
ncbi:MAG: hypothetical protein JO116_22770 [Planctomycetaceae bacterium]|nr:hypothetical protein [Planctomycetaceae bacterium]MBV8558373.1 hypothetical protein [Planctomycetaceae bacterium]